MELCSIKNVMIIPETPRTGWQVPTKVSLAHESVAVNQEFYGRQHRQESMTVLNIEDKKSVKAIKSKFQNKSGRRDESGSKSSTCLAIP